MLGYDLDIAHPRLTGAVAPGPPWNPILPAAFLAPTVLASGQGGLAARLPERAGLLGAVAGTLGVDARQLAHYRERTLPRAFTRYDVHPRLPALIATLPPILGMADAARETTGAVVYTLAPVVYAPRLT